MSTAYIDRTAADRLAQRLETLASYGVSYQKVAGRAKVPGTVVTGFLEHTRATRRMRADNAADLDAACREYEMERGLAKVCGGCGGTFALGDYPLDRRSADGRASICARCMQEFAMRKREEKERMKKEKVPVTADVVRRVKAEDKPDVDAAMLAPYFGITENQLLEIREGKHDALLLPPEPEAQPDATAALNALLKEMGVLRRTVEAAMIAAGFELPEVKQ